jgi:hypothetical protein
LILSLFLIFSFVLLISILPMIEILSDQWLVTVHREGEFKFECKLVHEISYRIEFVVLE